MYEQHWLAKHSNLLLRDWAQRVTYKHHVCTVLDHCSVSEHFQFVSTLPGRHRRTDIAAAVGGSEPA